MKWAPKVQKENLNRFLRQILACEGDMTLKISDNLFSRIAASGDISGLPVFHFRWKTKILPDVIIWPETSEQIAYVLKTANDCIVPLTVRAGGSSYVGSNVPAMGGILLDIKRMKTFEIDKERQILRVDAGATFSSVMNSLKSTQFALPCYPTSFKTATFGGWFSNLSLFGFGTAAHGEFREKVMKITIISPDGSISEIDNREQIKLYDNSAGLYGIVTSMEIRLIKQKNIHYMAFDFNNYQELMKFVEKIRDEKELHEFHLVHGGNSGPFEKPSVIVVFSEKEGKTRSFLTQNLNTTDGNLLDKDFAEFFKVNLDKLETLPKKHGMILLRQILLVPEEKQLNLINKFQTLCKKYKIQEASSQTMTNLTGLVRVTLMINANNEDWLSFIASKGILHQATKFAYRLGGRCHSYGLQNTIYLHKFEKIRLMKEREQKTAKDPNYILNPLKIVQTKIKFSRIEVMFRLALLFRRIQQIRKFNGAHTRSKPISPAKKNCINCGMCRETCPNYQLKEIEDYCAAGRIRIIRTIGRLPITFSKPQRVALNEIMLSCMTCHQCAVNCPVSFDFVSELEKYRAEINNYQETRK